MGEIALCHREHILNGNFIVENCAWKIYEHIFLCVDSVFEKMNKNKPVLFY